MENRKIGALIPYTVESTGRGERSMDIYSRLLEDRIVILGEEVTSALANTVIAQLLFLAAKDPEKDISLYVNSPGGSVTAGLAIVDTMNYIAPDVSTICMGMAASMGSVILSAGAKGKRLILPNAEVLIHQPLIGGGGISGQCTDIQIHAENMVKTRNRLESILAANSGKPIEVIHADCERDRYLSAEEAVEYGLVDKIIGKD